MKRLEKQAIMTMEKKATSINSNVIIEIVNCKKAFIGDRSRSVRRNSV